MLFKMYFMSQPEIHGKLYLFQSFGIILVGHLQTRKLKVWRKQSMFERSVLNIFFKKSQYV